MSESPDTLAKQIAALEAALQLPLPEESRRQLLANLQSLRADVAIAGDAVAGDKVGGDKVGGDKIVEPRGAVNVSGTAHIAVGVNLGRIIYGVDPTDMQREQLTRYLRRLAAKFQRLPLRGLAARLDEGTGIALSKVYMVLATESFSEVVRGGARELRPYYQDGKLDQPLKLEYTPDQALPTQAIVRVETLSVVRREERNLPQILSRSTLATEAVHHNQRLVLLGDPGGGKSTFLRHLAWALAQRGLDELSDETALFGWEDTTRLLPILLPLRKLAGRIAAEGAEPATVSAALRDEMTREYDARQADELLDQALESGAALLLFDGLDEVSLEPILGMSADRLTTLRAVRAFAELHTAARVVLTCRVRSFTEPLRSYLDWHVETFAPFTLGQIRHFVANWYDALIDRGSIAHDLGAAQQQTLIAALVGNARLRAMAGTPLLLTMMALVLSERGELLRDRPLLYERILEQLLGRWDQQKGGQSLTDVLDRQHELRSDDLRPILDKLSYEAHANATSENGRGRLAAKDLRYALAEFLETVRVGGAWEAAGRCLAYFNERSGLLLPEDDGQSYAFAHLTLQEHGAGRYMLLQPNAVELVMQRRADDRWREPIALGLGVIQKLYPMLADRIDRVLTELIDPDEGGRPKERTRWYRDLMLAAELGVERDWDLLRALINVDRLQRDLRRGLVALLGDSDQPLPIVERVRAGFLLGDLGDPRIPVTIDEWQHEIQRAMADDNAGYFCRVDPGTYIIGSGDDDPVAGDEEKPQHTIVLDKVFWIGRYPVTNSQWRAWVSTGGQRSYFDDDTDMNHPTQPVVGPYWQACHAFCQWLSHQTGWTLRLPTEYEWEAAARGGDVRRYPWGDGWQEDCAATEDDQNQRGWIWTVPVGCYPSGAAPCGALDMAGNAWEWTTDEWRSYPGAHQTFAQPYEYVLRGGGYASTRNDVRCAAREWLRGYPITGGFRAVFTN